MAESIRLKRIAKKPTRKRNCWNKKNSLCYLNQFKRKKLKKVSFIVLLLLSQIHDGFVGADPKSIVCAFFKQGQCGKGDKCKFSHDLSIERKAEKRSLYVDMRDPGDTEDTMENWDEDKLKEVIEKKHGKDKKMPTTDIVR